MHLILEVLDCNVIRGLTSRVFLTVGDNRCGCGRAIYFKGIQSVNQIKRGVHFIITMLLEILDH